MKIRVLFLSYNLGGGGAERVLVNLVNHMSKEIFDITIKTMFSAGVNKQLLLPHIHYENKNAPHFHGISYAMKVIPARWLYNYFVGEGEYDIVVAFMHGLPTKVISGAPKYISKVAWFHTDMHYSTLPDSFISRRSMISHLKRFDRLVGVSDTVVKSLIDISEIKEKLQVLYNVNDCEWITRCAKQQQALLFEKRNVPLICTVGSLNQIKGYNRLLICANRLVQEGIDFQLVIIGDGNERDNLERYIKEHCLEKHVFLIGFQNNPYTFIAQSDIFVCSSYSEGISTALSEALILGVPCISTLVSGAEELLGKDQEYGLVVENSDEGLFKGLKEMLCDKNMQMKYRSAAQYRKKFFSTERTVSRIEQMLISILEEKRRWQ